jgi:hypothetical protein
VSAPTLRVTRESNDVFVGPLTITATADGLPVIDGSIKFAVVAKGSRPVTADWTDPVSNPDTAAGGIGVTLSAAADYGTVGVWVQVTAGDATEVLDPDSVAWIIRT